ncbi:glycosyl transferase family 1 [Salipaludibacillus neizhouensis]|uniref:Glycosyl transferase family 1 n=1 Tax=Salipaludibacillus neizhouensis TaxID=885475 RepID=A0A3A9K002_9BACI|nr:glycosyltransferase family 1 protein [Salipaludibacillus neizhouensis]RKL66434.1 glycosyl transferase family 1 [Salipaludibacillus neizhouensis]
MEPIRVLQVVTIMNRGGLETMLMNYYRQMEHKKIQFDFLVHRSERGHYDDEIERLGGKIHRMPHIRPGNYRKYFRGLDKFFSENYHYKVVHSHINENSGFVLKAANRAGVPCRIAHSHLSDLGIDLKLPFRLYARLAMKNQPNRYFACSEKAGEWLFGKVENIKVLNNAVNVKEFQYNEELRKKVRRELQVENNLVIGHIGRFNTQKNHELLIDIFKKVNEKNPNSTLLLVGEGDLKIRMEEKVKKLGLSSAVKFLGVREDISEIMQGMDVFLFPSLFEGLPVVLVEAQAAGLKCIVSDTITSETDVTGQLDFKSLKTSPEKWATAILNSSVRHRDNATDMREKGFDTVTMATWLTDYYITEANGSQSKLEVTG